MPIDFVDLPGELHEFIFRYLDPVALISFAQTNRQFRAVITPAKEHFAERLLVLECQEEFGGPIFHFDGKDNSQSPRWDDERADQMRWACTHCLKLLHHRHFDNHSLLRLHFRKPLPEWPAAQLITSWEPMGKFASRAVLKSRIAFYRDYITLRRTQYKDGITDERYLCGYRRRQRQCNECRYQTGNLRSHIVTQAPGLDLEDYVAGPNLGTATTPIVKSRRLFHGSFIHRYFPGLFTDLPCYSPLADNAPNFPIHRQDARDRAFTHYMIRCAGCSIWKEMSAFRCGQHWPKWWPSHQHRWGTPLTNWNCIEIDKRFIDRLKCNSCYVAAAGRRELAFKLLSWYFELLLSEIWHTQQYMEIGWPLLYRAAVDGPDVNTWYHTPKCHQKEVLERVFVGLPWEDPDDKREGINVTYADSEMLKTMNEKHKLIQKNWGTWFVINPDEHRLPGDFNDWVLSWLNGYDNLEARLVWLRGCRDELVKRPGAILEWALNDKGRLTIDANQILDESAEGLAKRWDAPEIYDIALA
ncbi:hypothetical protein G7054_g7100 [Neopestalotiopsis clavispora]|nr:hypothetical protein G7054_g7100 [Neopestalotiopsis clavispora]